MADLPPPTATPTATPSGDTRVRPTRGSTIGTPRWVKVFVIVFIVLVLLFVILHLTGNGFGAHMHMSARDYGVQSR